jgi:hypothetical protein
MKHRDAEEPMEDSIDEALARIARKLDAVRAADPGCVIYGASQHRYRLNPCLHEASIAAFEERVGVKLPPEYRAFVQRLGNGGAGPDNGLHPLKIAQPEDYAALNRPFPVPDELAREAIARPEEERFLEGFEDVELSGCLETTDSGCGTFSFLIFTGGQRGTIWGSGGMCELIPVVGSEGEPMNFLAWYEDWCDYCLRPEVVSYWAGLANGREQA